MNVFPVRYRTGNTKPGMKAGNADIDPGSHSLDPFEALCKGKTAFLRAGGFTPDSAKKSVADGRGDAIVFGRWFWPTPTSSGGSGRGSN